MSDTARIHTKLTADGSELTRALEQGVAKASSFQGQMKNLGSAIGTAFSVAAVSGLVSKLANMADGIQDASGALDLTTDQLQAFDAAARFTAGGVDGMRTAIKKLIEVQAQAKDGNKSAQESIGKLGLGVEAYTMTTAQLVKALADYYARTGDLSAVHELFGRQAIQVREALAEIAGKSVPELIAKYDELGQIIDKQGIKKLAQFKDALASAGIASASFFVDFAEGFKVAMAGREWFDKRSAEQIFADEREAAGMGRGPAAKLATDEERAANEARAQAAAEAKLQAEIAAAKKITDARVNEEYEADMEIMSMRLQTEQRIADEAKAARQELFDWQMQMLQMDREAQTPGASDAPRNYSQLRSMGLAANDAGAAREKKSQEDKMISLEEKQLVALKELKGAVEKITGAKL